MIEQQLCPCYQWPMDTNRPKSSISKEEINELSLLVFPGAIEVICSEVECDRAVDFLRQQSLLGFDTECRPCFRKGEVHDIALLQLATLDRAFLFRLNLFRPTAKLLELLSSQEVKKVGVAAVLGKHGERDKKTSNKDG